MPRLDTQDRTTPIERACALLHAALRAACSEMAVGDLGNIEVSDEGKASVMIIDRYATLFGERCIIGR